MKYLPLTFLVIAICGVVLLAFVALDDSSKNWRPLTGPYPGTGFQIKDTFEIGSGGDYRLKITVPIKNSDGEGVALIQQPPLECILHVKISSNSTDYVSETIESLKYEGRSGYNGVDFYAATRSWNLKSGGYDVEIKSYKTPELLVSHGAMLTLEQYKQPVEWMLRHQLRLVAGVVLSGVGLLGLIVSMKK